MSKRNVQNRINFVENKVYKENQENQ